MLGLSRSPAALPAELQFPAAALCARAAPPPASGVRGTAPRSVPSQADLRRTGVHIGVLEL